MGTSRLPRKQDGSSRREAFGQFVALSAFREDHADRPDDQEVAETIVERIVDFIGLAVQQVP